MSKISLFEHVDDNQFKLRTEGVVDSFKNVVRSLGQKLGIEMFKTPQEEAEATEIYDAIKKYINDARSKGVAPSRNDMVQYMENVFSKYNLSPERKKIYWSAISTLRGHMIQNMHSGGRIGSIYGAR